MVTPYWAAPDATTAPAESLSVQRSMPRTSLRLVKASPSDWLQNPRYHIVRRLAAGGMGEVYLVRDLELQREVALKVLRSDMAEDPECTARFQEEARAVSALEHPNIVPIYDVGRTPDGQPWFTMKYVQGQTLEALLDDLRHNRNDAQARFPFAQRLQMIMQMAEAVAFAHQHGVLHRDLKPANIMVGPYGEITIMDWGLAKRRRAPLGGPLPNLTLAGCTCGTPGYIAPEDVEDSNQATEASDVYGLGVVMYELFALSHPYAGKSGMAAIISSLTEDAPSADELSSKVQGRVPREIARLVIARAMARKRDDRYQTMRQFIQAVAEQIAGHTPVVCPHSGLKRLLSWMAQQVDNRGYLVILALVVGWVTPLAVLTTLWLIR
jgi:serine/threonine-protein kinase